MLRHAKSLKDAINVWFCTTMFTIRVERSEVTVSVSRDGVRLRTFVCRCLQAAVALETKLNGDTAFASWWVTANEDPKPSAAHPYERPFSETPIPAAQRTLSRRHTSITADDTPTPAAQRTLSRHLISVTADDTLLIVTDGERTRQKWCSTGLVARNLASRYSNSPELAERWLYAEERAR